MSTIHQTTFRPASVCRYLARAVIASCVIFLLTNAADACNFAASRMPPSVRSLIDYLLIHVPAWLRERGL